MGELPGRKRLVAAKSGGDTLLRVHSSVGTGSCRSANVF
jgi:hypothetical protein